MPFLWAMTRINETEFTAIWTRFADFTFHAKMSKDRVLPTFFQIRCAFQSWISRFDIIFSSIWTLTTFGKDTPLSLFYFNFFNFRTIGPEDLKLFIECRIHSQVNPLFLVSVQGWLNSTCNSCRNKWLSCFVCRMEKANNKGNNPTITTTKEKEVLH